MALGGLLQKGSCNNVIMEKALSLVPTSHAPVTLKQQQSVILLEHCKAYSNNYKLCKIQLSMSTASRNWSIFILSSCCSCSKSFHKLLNFLPPTATISISSTCCNYIPLLHSSAHSLAYLLLPLTLITYCSSICPSSSPSTFFSLHWRRNRRVWQTVEEKAEAVV